MTLAEDAAVSEGSCDIFSFAVFGAVVLSVHAIVVVGAPIQFFVSLLQQHTNIKQTFHVNNITSCPMKAFIMQKN